MSDITLPGIPVLRVPTKGPGRPKGLAPYRPRPGSKNDRILTAAQAVLDLYRLQKRLPLGPREIGYILTGPDHGFTKADIDAVEDVIVRARRAGIVAWADIADGRTFKDAPWVVADVSDAIEGARRILQTAQLDRQDGQPCRIEVWAEAAAWVHRLALNCGGFGVPVYSGSGSVPVTATRAAARRALAGARYATVPTIFLTITDLDPHGLRNIGMPFEDDVRAFVRDYGRVDPDSVMAVRRLVINPEQVERHVGTAALDSPTSADIAAGWPWPYKVQAEALAPEIRDDLVVNSIEALQSHSDARDRVLAAESILHRRLDAVVEGVMDGLSDDKAR